MTREHFQVDLRGIVQILSQHLYSSPRVYVRELIQNARDAVAARRLIDPSCPAVVEIRADDAAGELTVRDSGIGLTAEDMATLLSTVGASSKRGRFEEARGEFLGQFGIGLLSCFLVADVIEVRSRSARVPDAPTVTWRGFADGTYTIDGGADADRDALPPLDAPGTEVRLRARPDDRQWVGPRRVRRLAEQFARYLDLRIDVVTERGTETISQRTPPWRDDDDNAMERCVDAFGFEPIATLPLSVAVAGVEGVAFVTDHAGRASERPDDVVFSRGMLVSESNHQLVPSWASFARAMIDAGALPVTASRESLLDSRLLDDVREEIGRQLRAGIDELADRDPDAFASFLHLHGRALCAMAVEDDGLLDLVERHVPFETSIGPRSLASLLSTEPVITYTTQRHRFDALATIVDARGGVLVNAS